MGLKYSALDSQLFITTITNNAQQALEVVGKMKSGEQYLINSLGDGTGLSGAGYTAGQGLFREIILPATSQFEQAIQDVLADVHAYQKAETAVYQYGDLDEDDLNLQINLKKQQKANFEHQKSYYESLKPMDLGLSTTYQITWLNQAIQTTENQIRRLEEQLEALQMFEYQTSTLFQDSLDAFSNIVQGIAALKQIQVDSSGHYHTDGVNMEWLTNLKEETFSSDLETQKDYIEANAMDLGLSPEGQAYYNELAQKALEGVPFDQWDEKLRELKYSLYYDDEGNIVEANDFMQGKVVLKNGVKDDALTQAINDSINRLKNQAFKDNAGQIFTGVLGTALGLLGMGIGTVTVPASVLAALPSGGTSLLAGAGVVVSIEGASATLTATSAAAVSSGFAQASSQIQIYLSNFNRYGDKKTSVTINSGKYVEARVGNKKVNLRVDAEADSGKLQVQEGGKGNYTINAEFTDIESIVDEKSAMNALNKNKQTKNLSESVKRQLAKYLVKGAQYLKSK